MDFSSSYLSDSKNSKSLLRRCQLTDPGPAQANHTTKNLGRILRRVYEPVHTPALRSKITSLSYRATSMRSGTLTEQKNSLDIKLVLRIDYYMKYTGLILNRTY